MFDWSIEAEFVATADMSELSEFTAPAFCLVGLVFFCVTWGPFVNIAFNISLPLLFAAHNASSSTSLGRATHTSFFGGSKARARTNILFATKSSHIDVIFALRHRTRTNVKWQVRTKPRSPRF